MRIEGTQEGDSKPGVQKWIPTPDPPKKPVRDRYSNASLAFMALKDYMEKDILKVYDNDGIRISPPSNHYDLAKILTGKELMIAGKPIGGEELTELVNQWRVEWRRSWKRVQGVSIGHVDRIGHKGSTSTRDEIESKGFQ